VFFAFFIIPVIEDGFQCYSNQLWWQLLSRRKNQNGMASYSFSPMFENDTELDDSFDFIDDKRQASDEGHYY